jgi:hypothetical protein
VSKDKEETITISGRPIKPFGINQSLISKSIQLRILLIDAEPLYLMVFIHQVSTPSTISWKYMDGKPGIFAK